MPALQEVQSGKGQYKPITTAADLANLPLGFETGGGW